jgi:hypothetical protein
MSALERPTRLPVIEARLHAARPPDELSAPSEMLDVTSTALLPAILAPVEARLLPYPNTQVVVARKTGVGVEPLTRRVALAAIRITLELGVRATELSRREELGARLARHERAAHRSRDHQRAQEHHGFDAPAHSEKIQR